MTAPRHPVATLLALLVAMGALATPAGAAPSRLVHEVDRVNGHLRVAIEYAPEELGEALGSAEVVCGLGERAGERGEADAAAADWTTLRQLIDEFAVGSSNRVQIAFGKAYSSLAAIRERYERRWAGDPRLPALRHGVRTATLGIGIMERSIGALDVPFAEWRAHRCAAARTGVETAFRRIPTGLRLIDLGMLELWRVSGLLPSPDSLAPSTGGSNSMSVLLRPGRSSTRSLGPSPRPSA